MRCAAGQRSGYEDGGDFKKHAESGGHQSLTKEAAKYAEEYGLSLKLQYRLIQPASQKKEGLYKERSLKAT